MGDPKKQRKKYKPPRFPWFKDELDNALKLIGQYGLRNKHELWRHRTTLSKYRTTARSLLSATPEEREKHEKELLNKLYRMGITSKTATLDEVLDLSIEDILERRLQTIVLRHGLAKTIQQARQLITHGHILVAEKRITTPSYLVGRNEENTITYTTASPLTNKNHPTRKTIEAVQTATTPQTKEEN